MPPFKDEHVLIIAPGSEITLAQLGLPESFTPAQHRFPTRMFPADKEGEWEPHRIREKQVPATTNGNTNGTTEPSAPAPAPAPAPVDVEMKDQPTDETSEVKAETTTEAPAAEESTATTTTYEEVPESTEGAVYPIRQGKVEDWSCFLALVTHIFNTLSPPFHTPVLVVAQPCWSSRDHEIITQFFFENFKIPAFCLIDSALATCYAYGVPSATVVDVGHGKCDVTAVSEFVPQESGRGVAVADCGGDTMTQRLLELLGPQGFTYDMCEQLKKSGICEILLPGAAMPGQTNGVGPSDPNPAAAATTGAATSGPGATEADGKALGQAPRGPGAGTEIGESRDEGEDDEGVLDVASIIARGDASEYLAKREKEKAEKAAERAAAKKAGAAAEAAARQAKLKNSEKEKASFQFSEYVPVDATATNGAGQLKKRKRDIEVGPERLLAATPRTGSALGTLDIISATINNTIQSVADVTKRSDLWDNLIIVGNGSKVRGFKEALILTLSTKYVVSPSSATIFTSELPSNLSTPLPTGGTNTPLGQSTPLHHPAAHGVNPLLVAATHANQATPQPSFIPPSLEQHSRHGHNQTPSSVKTIKAPEYFSEWKDAKHSGMEEIGFLGAQVAAKVVFVVDQGISKGFFTRSDYNEMGPAGIHEYSL